jgi:hypothetical protein
MVGGMLRMSRGSLSDGGRYGETNFLGIFWAKSCASDAHIYTNMLRFVARFSSQAILKQIHFVAFGKTMLPMLT